MSRNRPLDYQAQAGRPENSPPNKRSKGYIRSLLKECQTDEDFVDLIRHISKPGSALWQWADGIRTREMRLEALLEVAEFQCLERASRTREAYKAKAMRVRQLRGWITTGKIIKTRKFHPRCRLPWCTARDAGRTGHRTRFCPFHWSRVPRALRAHLSDQDAGKPSYSKALRIAVAVLKRRREKYLEKAGNDSD